MRVEVTGEVGGNIEGKGEGSESGICLRDRDWVRGFHSKQT